LINVRCHTRRRKATPVAPLILRSWARLDAGDGDAADGEAIEAAADLVDLCFRWCRMSVLLQLWIV
jgi:hypothetical protein